MEDGSAVDYRHLVLTIVDECHCCQSQDWPRCFNNKSSIACIPVLVFGERPSIVRIKPIKSHLINPFTHFHARQQSTLVRFFLSGHFDSIFRFGGYDLRELLDRKSTQGRINNERRGKGEGGGRATKEEEEQQQQLEENPERARWFNLGRICKFTRSILTALKENIDSSTTPLMQQQQRVIYGGNIPPRFVICFFPQKNFRQITAEWQKTCLFLLGQGREGACHSTSSGGLP